MSAAGVAVVAVSTATYSMVTPALAPAAAHQPERLLPPPLAMVPVPTFSSGPTVTRTPRAGTTQTHRPVRPTAPTALSAPAEEPAEPSAEVTTKPTAQPTGPVSEPPDCTIQNRWDRDVKPQVRQVACLLHERYPGVTNLLGVGPGSVHGSDHPKGLAVDVVINQDRITGAEIAACAARHYTDWGLSYVLWNQTALMKAGGEFEVMRDRGSASANHRNHVHLSFRPRSEPIPVTALTCGKEEKRP